MAYVRSLPAARRASGVSLRTLPALFTAIVSVARQRRALALMTADQLNDVGLTINEAHAESKRPFWDVPANWKA